MRPLRFQPEYPKRMMKYACRDLSCIRGYIRPGKASLSKTPIFNLLITPHKTAPNLQGTKPAVWLAVRSVCCQPVSPGFLPKFREKSRGKIARVQGRVCGRICGSVQARNFLPDSRFPCGTDLRSGCRERVLPGWQPALIGCQLRPCRPDIPDLPGHTAPRLPPGGPSLHGTADRTGQPDARGSMPVSRVGGTRSCPGNTGVAPGEQDGTGKTGPPDRRRDLPDPIRRTGAGLPRAGPERVPSREGFFAAGHAGLPDVFSPPTSREFRREPSCGFPARFRGHFVSDDPSEKFYAMITTGWRRRKSETKRNAKKQPRRSREVRRMTPTSPPRREGPVIFEPRGRHPVAANTPLASRSIGIGKMLADARRRVEALGLVIHGSRMNFTAL